MEDLPEDRARTVLMLMHWGLWPPSHRCGRTPRCVCRECFNPSPMLSIEDDELKARRTKRRVSFPWEIDAA